MSSLKKELNRKRGMVEMINPFPDEMKSNTIVQLNDMFGNLVPKRVLNRICKENNWELNICTQEVIDYIDNNKSNSEFNYFNNPNENEGATSSHNYYNVSRKLGAIPKQYASNTNIKSQECFTPTRSQGCFFDSRESASEHLQNITRNINKGYKVMVIMRGAPGSGKSFLAKDILNKTLKSCDYQNHIFSTDSFFYDAFGNYKFHVNYLKDAHEYNQKQVFEKVINGWSPIFVDNTNVKLWEMIPYAKVAIKNGYLVYILQPNTPWAFSAKVLARKNSHQVPKESISRMLSNFETGNASFLYKIKHDCGPIELPQLRQHPSLHCSENVSTDNNKQTIFNVINWRNETEENQYENKNIRNDDHFVSEELKNSIKCLEKLKVKEFTSENEYFYKSDNRHIELFDNIVTPMENASKMEENIVTSDEILESEKDSNFDEESDPFAPMPQRQKKSMPVGINLIELLRDSPPIIKTESEELELHSNNSSLKMNKHKIGCRNECKTFAILRQIYPEKQVDSLWDLFEKCKGDADWVIDILLKDDFNGISYCNNNISDFDCSCDSSPSSKELHDTPIHHNDNRIVDGKFSNSKNNKFRWNTSNVDVDEKLKTKQAIENQFVIGENYYSDYLKKIRSYKNATSTDNTGKKTDVDSENSNIETETFTVTETDEIVSSVSDANEMVEINLGTELIYQLDRIFNTDAKDKPTNFLTNVFIPKSLAQQLYIIWLESYFNQKEEQRRDTVKADQEFARLITEQYNYDQCPNNFKEILDMETAWDNYKSEHLTANWKNLMPTDLASHLTRMKLYELFPDVEKETLLEVYFANNYNYAETVKFLKKSVSSDDGLKLNDNNRLDELIVADTLELDRKAKPQSPSSKLTEKKLLPSENKRILLEEFEENRNMAVHYNQLKSECYQKAKEAIQKDNGSVAVYYSEIAKLHRSKADMCNQKAANSIVAVHDLSQSDPDFIDLHYLHVNEALECLDFFIDKHIFKIISMARSYKNIFIITGRGLHSSGGISAIKTSVKKRLKERQLTWSEVNPGLLKVKIYLKSTFTETT